MTETREQMIWRRLEEHLNEAMDYFPADQIVGIFLQGSQNYNLDYEDSDIDTKLIVVPSLDDICRNRKPISTTHVRENNEHIDFKDIRLYIETFRKQNLNFLEILFTKYKIINPLYADEWGRLEQEAEAIARMNPRRNLKAMKGMAMEKFHAKEHKYPSKIDIIDKYGYDGKQVSHLLRIKLFIEDYLAGKPYAECMIPAKSKELMVALKRQEIPYTIGMALAEKLIAEIENMVNNWHGEEKENENTLKLLYEVQTNIVKIGIKNELKGED